MNIKKSLRKVTRFLHEAISPLGYVVWLDHQIQEIDEAIEELKKMVR